MKLTVTSKSGSTPQAAQAPQPSVDTLVDQILSNDEAIVKLKEKLGL